MAGWVADYSYSRPNLAGLRAAGCTGVIRYVSPGRPTISLTRSEATQIRQAGLDLGCVVQMPGPGSWMLAGHPAGVAAAGGARSLWRQAGVPDGMLYLAADFDATHGGPTVPGSVGDRQMQKVADCLRGAADTIGWPSVGVYASFYALDWLTTHQVPVAACWQTQAWSGGHIHPRAALLQLWPPEKLAGGEVDRNRILGDWHPRRENDMPRQVAALTLNVHRADLSTPAWRTVRGLIAAWGVRIAVDDTDRSRNSAALIAWQKSWASQVGPADGIFGPRSWQHAISGLS